MLSIFYDLEELIYVVLGLTLAATILTFVFIIPESKRKTLSPFMLFLHNVFNFKQLVIEKILQFSYVFGTYAVLVLGLITMFDSEFLAGLIIMLVGPIAIRISFEAVMMIILAVKNVIQINEKLNVVIDNQNPTPSQGSATQQSAPQQSAPQYSAPQYSAPQQTAPQYSAPSYQSAPQQNTNTYSTGASLFCTECGSPLNNNGSCSNPNCSKYSR